jgi:hypothetical protein
MAESSNHKSKLFEYVILHHYTPTKAEEEQGKKPTSKLLVEPTRLLARDEREAMLALAREIPAEYLDRLDEVEVVLRPF